MTSPRRILWLLCAALVFNSAGTLRASLNQTVATTNGSGVKIEITGPADEVPPDGCYPCWVTIHNRSGATRTWNIQATEQSYAEHGDSISTSQSLPVENDSVARAAVLIPLSSGARSGGYSYQSISLEINGYGVEGQAAPLANTSISRASSTAFVGMGEALATPIWASLQKKYSDASRRLYGSTVAPTQISPDWRALSGFGCLWLADTEYTTLDAGQRAAIRRWVDQGGTFYLSARTLDPALRASLDLPDDGTEGHQGYGLVRWLPWDGKPLELDRAVAIIDGITARRSDPDTHDATNWGMMKSVGAIPLNAPFLLGFIGLFAVVAGPVNLFMFAPATRRHRLFWTTPLISAVGSLLLVAVILLQDGFGGRGERVMVTRLFPGQRQAVVVQEQVARTGVLLSRQFTLPEDTLLSPLGASFAGRRRFAQAGRECSGDWFMSRLVQAHRAETIVPSRAEIQLLNPAEAGGGAPPVVVSSIPATLREIVYHAPAGTDWHGSNLHTGERATLRQDGQTSFTVTTGSAYLTGLQRMARLEPGTFFAVADDGPFIETLPSVRWRNQQAVFLGPVTPVR